MSHYLADQLTNSIRKCEIVSNKKGIKHIKIEGESFYIDNKSKTEKICSNPSQARAYLLISVHDRISELQKEIARVKKLEIE